MPASPPVGLIRDVARLVQAIQRQHLGVDEVLNELTRNTVDMLPNAQYAGITVASRDGKVRTASATHACPTLLDAIQERHQEGPCLAAAWEQRTVRIDDMTTEERWPAFCRDVVDETPIRSVMSFQLFVDHNTMAALNFFAEQPAVFDDDALEAGLILATHAAIAWNVVRRDEQFRSALASRDIIGQAKGMMMERFKIDAAQAFELLKRLSQSSNTPLADVAQRLVESEQRGK